MKLKDRIKGLLRGQMPVTIIFIVLGLCLVFLPAGTLNVLCKVFFGLALILTGVYHILIQVFEKPGRNASIPDLYTGVITAVIGLFLFANSQLVVKLLPWMLGAFIVADCLWMLKGGFRMKKLRVDFWKVLIIGAVLFAALGIVLICFPFKQVRTMLMFAGWLFVAKGVSDVFLYLKGRKLLTAAEAKAAMKPNYKMMTMREDYPESVDSSYHDVQPDPDPVIYQGTAAQPEEGKNSKNENFGDVEGSIHAPWESMPDDMNEETGE